MIEFRSITEFPRGTLYRQLSDAYSFDGRWEVLFGESWKERMEKFLISCGVTKEEIENIREIMLEK